MKRLLMLAVLIVTPAHAADKALILSDQQQGAYRAILDAAIRANGLSSLSRNAFILSDMLDQAGVVTEHKENPPPQAQEPKKESDQ
jgi:hypothetical protein